MAGVQGLVEVISVLGMVVSVRGLSGGGGPGEWVGEYWRVVRILE